MRQKNIKYLLAKLLLSLIFLVLLASCAAWRKNLRSSGEARDAISNCIVDFVNTSTLQAADDVFEIKVIDHSRCTYYVSIGAVEKRSWTLEDDSLYSRRGAMFPTCYKILDNRLFLWYDPDVPVSEDLLSAMRQYDYKLPLDCSFVEVPGGAATDIYYVSKNDVAKYRKAKTSGIIPSLKWDKKTTHYSYNWPRYVHENIPVLIPCENFDVSHACFSHRLLVSCSGLKDTLNVGVSFKVSLELPVSDDPTKCDTIYDVELTKLIYSKANSLKVKRTILTPEDVDELKKTEKEIWNCCERIISYWGACQPYDVQEFKNGGSISYVIVFYLVPSAD